MNTGIFSFRNWVIGITLAAGTVGCGAAGTSSQSSAITPDAKYVTQSEPAGALPVGKARESAKDKEEIVLVGRIGGSEKPFIDDMAAFTIVDPKVPYCSPEEGCPTPWDYCCEQNQVKNNIAMVKVTDGQKKTVTTDARKLLGVKELNMVVVKGEARRDADGNLSVLAEQVFIKE